MSTPDDITDSQDYEARRISMLERELVNAKNHVRRLEIQLSELKQRQRRDESTRSRIAELFLASSATGKRQENPGN